jgi:hypothetical protein
MPQAAGYSGTPLFKKLGIKSGMRVSVEDAPEGYWDLLSGVPGDIEVLEPSAKSLDFVHAFVTTRKQLRDALPRLLKHVAQNGTIWISWPKRASGVPTDVTEDVVREEALPIGLVDVKVCAVDAVWSGLKLVIRKENRRLVRAEAVARSDTPAAARPP